jgi:hypothetical protein
VIANRFERIRRFRDGLHHRLRHPDNSHDQHDLCGYWATGRYTANRIWYPDADVNIDGIKTLIQIYGEQGQLKGPLPSPARYVDQSYLKEALKELGNR